MGLWRYELLISIIRTVSYNIQAKCDANPDFQPVASGGNGKDISFCKRLLIPFSSVYHLTIYRVCWVCTQAKDGDRRTPRF